MTTPANKPTLTVFTPLEELSYEQARAELVEIVRILELGQMSLDESLHYWERGEELAKHCENYLAGATTRIETVLKTQDNSNDEVSLD
ncbi:exodeoxyribonuclease VII small subunit [Corynebacterium kutscheri]|uniref:Exodeoxyribonuclease 7 small subunit n=1 Tax=Corynebacterium kutscheri TaxID=35755 RepID=A0A0F6R2N1_9CORY|nr:exodeoxyribonuclease VII small subunit [Corynebacterium kutscheri]AKE41758.1 Exodeoxyribonuclease VII small subunit [Corynebacterium kutscheri]VEH10084.1 exodeoxyribonuclease VII small subunit [Corynebacterium kutscheri]VEH80166.1 exodeoxyribonuclease VII small subunit [Corynebacterium kutscheri]